MKKIAFIGIGIMGEGMIRNLMKSGYELYVFNRTKSKADRVISEGAIWCDSVKDCVREVDAVITIIGMPKDVEDVYFGVDGIIENVKSGTYLIDMTTTDPSLSIRIYEEASKVGAYALDAPVSGGGKGATEGTLSIMVGGDREVFDRCMDVFQAMGTTITYQGKAGSGQHTKMANQIAICGAIAGVAEAITYARSKNLDMDCLYDSVSKGAAGSFQFSINGLKMIKGDDTPGFFIKHFAKDLSIAKSQSEADELNLEVLGVVLEMYRNLEEKGFSESGMHQLDQYYKQH